MGTWGLVDVGRGVLKVGRGNDLHRDEHLEMSTLL